MAEQDSKEKKRNHLEKKPALFPFAFPGDRGIGDSLIA